MIRQLPDLGTSIAFVLLAGAVTLSPLPFGSVLPRDRLWLQVAIFMALAILLLFQRDRELGDWLHRAKPALAIAAIGVLGLPPALSLAPDVSRGVALLWLAMAAAMVVAVAIASGRHWRRLLGLGLLATTLAEIVYGADRWFRRSSDIWDTSVSTGSERLRGTFVNADHFAMFLIVGLAIGFAVVWWSMRRAGFVPLEKRLLYIALPWLLFIMIFVALAFTGSRAGLVGGLAALLAQGLLLGVSERRWQASLLGIGSVLVGLASLLYFGWQQGLRRWIGTSAYEITWNLRFDVYRDSFELWTRFPWTGTGLGTFRQAFPAVQSFSGGTSPAVDTAWFHAHSDILELLVTTGLVGFSLALWGLFILLRRLWQALRYGRRSEDQAMALAAWGTLAGVMAHSLIDFGLTLPSNAVLVVVVLGLACGVPKRRAMPPTDTDPG